MNNKLEYFYENNSVIDEFTVRDNNSDHMIDIIVVYETSFDNIKPFMDVSDNIMHGSIPNQNELNSIIICALDDNMQYYYNRLIELREKNDDSISHLLEQISAWNSFKEYYINKYPNHEFKSNNHWTFCITT